MKSLLSQPLPVLLKRSEQGGVVRLFYARSCQDDDIQSPEHILLPAETFPDQALDSVAIHRAADMLLGYCQSQPGRFPPVVTSCEHSEMSVRGTYRIGEYLFIIPGAQQPGMAGKTFGRDGFRSGSQTGTALGAAGIDNLAAAPGCHAGAKTMGTGTLEITGLKCTFHCSCTKILFRSAEAAAGHLTHRHEKDEQI